MVHQIATGSIGKLCWYSRILQEHSGSCIGTEEYYRSTREAMLVQQSNIGALVGCVGTAQPSHIIRTLAEDVLVQQSTTGALWKLYWNRRIL